MRYWWIRHAPVDHGGRLYGCSDWSCLPFGKEEVLHLQKVLPLGRGVSVVTSDLQRTHQTLRAISEDCFGRRKQDGRLNEQNLGILEGVDYNYLAEGKYKEWDRLLEDFLLHCPEGGESFSDVVDRVGESVEDMVGCHEEGDDVVVVAHAGVIRAAIVHCVGLPRGAGMSFDLAPLSLTVLERGKRLSGEGERWRLLCSNWCGGEVSF